VAEFRDPRGLPAGLPDRPFLNLPACCSPVLSGDIVPFRCRLLSGGSLIQFGTKRDIRPLRPDGAARCEGIVTLLPGLARDRVGR